MRPVLPLLLVCSLATLQAQTPETRIEQARQFTPPSTATDTRSRAAVSDFPASELIVEEDDAFGAQRILKEQERAMDALVAIQCHGKLPRTKVCEVVWDTDAIEHWAAKVKKP